MPKKDIHPEWYDNAEVYCDGQLVYTVSSTKEDRKRTSQQGINNKITFIKSYLFLY